MECKSLAGARDHVQVDLASSSSHFCTLSVGSLFMSGHIQPHRVSEPALHSAASGTFAPTISTLLGPKPPST